MTNAHILLVCADPLELKLLELALKQPGQVVTAVAHPDNMITEPSADLIVLVSHDDQEHHIIHEIRARLDAPLLLLTDFQRETDHINALAEGVDFIFFRPYSTRFLAAQIPALLRRLQQTIPPEPEPELIAGDIRLDPGTQTLQLGNDQPTRLSHLEFRLLHTLMLHPRQVIPTGSLIEHVWGYNGEGNDELVRKLVWRLRAKLKDNGREPCYIHTIPNVGYSFRQASEHHQCAHALAY
jgi:DNA-binding response OmpR family regulator